MKKYFIVGNELTLYSNILTEKPVKIESVALLESNELDGVAVWVHYWDFEEGGKTVKLCYSLKPDLNSQIFDVVLKCGVVETELKAPKGCKWDSFQGKWYNVKKNTYHYAV